MSIGLPLTLFDRGDSWEIQGSNIAPSSLGLQDSTGGVFVMIIAKTDGKITKLIREMVPAR